jgi:tetratricopeptide (TPR) repeat protein
MDTTGDVCSNGPKSSTELDMNTEQTLQQAIDDFNGGKLSDALQRCLAVLDEAGDNVDALHLGGIIAFQQGKADMASNLIWKAVQLDPGFLDAYLNLGQIYQHLGRNEDAAACFQKALELDPANGEARALLDALTPHAPLPSGSHTMSVQEALEYASREHREGNLEQAEGIYQAILQAEPSNADALHLLGIIRAQQSRFDESIDLIRQAIAANPLPGYYNNLAMVYDNSGNAAEAEACRAKAVTLSD